MSLTVQLAAALAITCLSFAALIAALAPPAPRHRRRGLAHLPLGVQLALVVLVAAAVINPRLTLHPGA